MNRGPRSPILRCLPAGLCGAVILIAAAEAILSTHALTFTRFYIDDWKVAGAAARTDARDSAILFLGDSLVKFGLRPGVVQARLGLKAYNLAICDGQAASSYFLLRRAIASGARPRAVIVDFAPHLLAAGPRHSLRQWPELVGFREGLDLVWSARHAGFLAELALSKVFSSFKDRHEIRGLVLADLRGNPTDWRGQALEHRRTWRLERGAERSLPRPSYHGEFDARNPGYFPTKWTPHPVNASYVDRLLRLAAANDLRVYWILPPVIPGFQARREALGLESAYAKFLATFTRKFTHLAVIDARGLDLEGGGFIDPLHLDEQGATALSRAAASILASSFETDRLTNQSTTLAWNRVASGPDADAVPRREPSDTQSREGGTR